MGLEPTTFCMATGQWLVRPRRSGLIWPNQAVLETWCGQLGTRRTLGRVQELTALSLSP